MKTEDKRKYDREYYSRYSKEQKAHKNKLQRARIKRLRYKINHYKLKHPCPCGETHLACLEFHHIKENKEINIADALRHGWAWSRFLKEIDKCVVLCANCHRKLHWT